MNGTESIPHDGFVCLFVFLCYFSELRSPWLWEKTLPNWKKVCHSFVSLKFCVSSTFKLLGIIKIDAFISGPVRNCRRKGKGGEAGLGWEACSGESDCGLWLPALSFPCSLPCNVSIRPPSMVGHLAAKGTPHVSLDWFMIPSGRRANRRLGGRGRGGGGCSCNMPSS